MLTSLLLFQLVATPTPDCRTEYIDWCDPFHSPPRTYWIMPDPQGMDAWPDGRMLCWGISRNGISSDKVYCAEGTPLEAVRALTPVPNITWVTPTPDIVQGYVAALDFATCEWIIDGKHVPEYRVPPKACELMKKHSLPGERVETPNGSDDGGE